MNTLTIRPWFDSNRWQDWRWHAKRAADSIDTLRGLCSANLTEEQTRAARAWQERGLRFSLTPHVLTLVETEGDNIPKSDDPIWRQFFPLPLPDPPYRPDEYTPVNENWEERSEMLTPIAQQKYPNRIILYISESCFSYCGYCLRALQSEAPEERHGHFQESWAATLEAIRSRPEIEEVILSGGEPLTLNNYFLDGMLRDVRSIPSVRAVRINTRVLTHNPERVDWEFSHLLRRHRVTGLGIHVAHPRELTIEFSEAIGVIRANETRTVLLAQIPLIKGINDDVDVLRELFMSLYLMGIKPYYLLHCMPNIPAANLQRTSVQRGVQLMLALKRHLSNPAMPEYIIVHRTGKKTVPLELGGTPEFCYGRNADGHPIIQFRDWKGAEIEYLDAP